MSSNNDFSDVTAVTAKMTLEEKIALCSGDGWWKTEGIKRLGIEPIVMTDGPHGLRREADFSNVSVQSGSLEATCFPASATVACSFDRETVGEIGKMMAHEATEVGVDIILGPGVNIKRSPLCGRNFEYYSEDPFLAGEMASAMINGMQSNGVGACIKHFVANNQEYCRFTVDSCVDKRTLFELYLEPFRIAVEKAQPWSVMSSYNKINGEYSGESEFIIKKTLRENFGFKGAVMSDWGAVNDRVKGLKAGLDLEMPGKETAFSREIRVTLKNGTLTEAELDLAVGHILALVKQCKTAHKPSPPENIADVAHELARRASCASSVLLKNDGGLLPFNDGKPFALIGEFAENPRYQGAGSSHVNAYRVGKITEELKLRELPFEYTEGYLPDGSTNDELVERAKQAAVKAGRAVIAAGLPSVYESEGFDRDDMKLPDGMLKLIDAVSSVCDKVAVVLMLGAPVELPFEKKVGAILAVYLGGEAAGEATADIITGRVNPSGKLAESWPETLEQTPCYKYYKKNKNLAYYAEGKYVGYRYYDAAEVAPRYPFGFGLSYTSFALESVRADKKRINRGESATVSLSVKNKGERPGAEVVQVYVGRKGELLKELKGFEKVSLFAKESKSVTVELPYESFSYYDIELKKRIVADGEYIIYVGTSSRDITEQITVKVEGEQKEQPAYIEPSKAADMSEAEFFSILGYIPEEVPRRPFTLNSTPDDLRHTAPGKIMFRMIKKQLANDATGPENLAMVEKSIENTPLREICAMAKGMFPRYLADMIVDFANRKVLKGISNAFKKH